MNGLLSVTVNGEVRQMAFGATVVSLLADLGLDPTKVAVERNRAEINLRHHRALGWG
jgi:thiazole synthase